MANCNEMCKTRSLNTQATKKESRVYRAALLRFNHRHILAMVTEHLADPTQTFGGGAQCVGRRQQAGGTRLAEERQKDDIFTDGGRQLQSWEGDPQ